MSAPTKKRLIRKNKPCKKTPCTPVNVSRKKAAAEEIAKYSEPGLMLRGCRHKKEITQKNLATSIGISQHHISEMENGKRPIGKSLAKRLATFFKTDYRVFL